MLLISAFVSVLLLAAPAWGTTRSLTLYLDGAHEQFETSVIRESIELSLPSASIDNSLRIRPLDGCTIDHVDISMAKPDQSLSREMARLIERRNALTDRLRALETKEAVFSAAAKTQSGKTPRKTKTNPEPLVAIKQGIDYAISQLEGVYRGRRTAEDELKAMEERISTLKKELNQRVVKIAFPRKGCKIAVSYVRSDLKWAPSYDFRLNRGGEVEVAIRAVLPSVEVGTRLAVVPSTLVQAPKEAALPVLGGSFPVVSRFTLPLEQEHIVSTPIDAVSFRIKNNRDSRLPRGESSCFLLGEYLGKGIFEGADPGEVREMMFGDYLKHLP